jgi:hypothetical protein
VRAAPQLLPARQAAPDVGEPARLVLARLLAADAALLDQEGALGARDVVRVALVRDGRVAAGAGPGAVEAALGRARAARLRRLEDGPAAGAADLVEDGFKAGWALSAVAELLAGVLPAPECATARVEADVLGFDVLARVALLLAALHGSLLARTAALSALVAPAVQLCSADAEAHWLLDVALVAD